MLNKVKRIISRQYIKKALKQEKKFKIKEEPGRIKYLFHQNKKSDKLLVVFSGFPTEGKPPVYNYLLTFRNLECNKLFILDDFGDDPRGTFYLGTNENLFLIDEVTNLISYIKKQTGIKNEDITLTGSSKGGYASLYYAIKDNYGSVIVGEPQVLLGEYLTVVPEHLPVFENIMGEYSDTKKEKLNKSLLDIAEKSNEFPSKIQILCGKGSTYYLDNHIKHLTDILDEKGISYQLKLGDFKDHSQIGKHYPRMVTEHYSQQ